MPPILAELAVVWRGLVGRASRAALFSFLVVVVLGGAHLARLGTPAARLATGGLVLGAIFAILLRTVRERRDFQNVARTIGRVLVPSDDVLGHRALRALRVVERTREGDGAGSPDLAREHFDRLLRKASTAAVEQSAKRRASAWSLTGAAAMLGAIVAVVVGPMRIAEGLDVLVARDGRAPVPLVWLEIPRITAQLPAYLRKSDRPLWSGMEADLPEGSVLTVRGRPVRDGRRLVITDGLDEVPFVSDGKGGVVARWTLGGSVSLRVAARFGDVLIEAPESLELRALADEAPQVELESSVESSSTTAPLFDDVKKAPATFQLRDIAKLELRFAAHDDHGIRQVDLVLRAGSRTDRRTLTRLDGESRLERGGYVLFGTDNFLRRMFLPVQVTVEARDNDPVGGSKWGTSPAITLLPPAVGEPEALRLSSLLNARDEVAALVAWRTDNDLPAEPDKRRQHEKEDVERALAAADKIRVALEVRDQLRVPAGLRTFLGGQADVLARKVPAGGSALRIAEDVLLALDKAIRGLARRDAQAVSKRLGDVAEEAADGAKQARDTEDRDAGVRRLDLALASLEAGAEQLLVLGALGRDIGSVAQADTRRVRRARDRESLMHAELAARHLAARLRRPRPSFGSKGGNRKGSVESGTTGTGEASGEPSQADEQFDQLAGEVDQLAQDHAEQIARVEQALAEAEAAVDLADLEDEAKERAREIRRSVSSLPAPGAEPGSARASAALAREHAGAMAHALEQLSLEDAVESGKNAMSALEEAERKLAGRDDPYDRIERQTIAEAKRRLRQQLEWAEEQLERARREVAARARETLGQQAKTEQDLARRAGNLASRGKIAESAMPEKAVDDLEGAESLMRQAARELLEGKGREGLARQREAQRLLEQADTGQTTDPDGSRREDQKRGANGQAMRRDGTLPDEGDGNATRDFRERVLEGLAKKRGGRLAPAVKRYAEGLLE